MRLLGGKSSVDTFLLSGDRLSLRYQRGCSTNHEGINFPFPLCMHGMCIQIHSSTS